MRKDSPPRNSAVVLQDIIAVLVHDIYSAGNPLTGTVVVVGELKVRMSAVVIPDLRFVAESQRLTRITPFLAKRGHVLLPRGQPWNGWNRCGLADGRLRHT